MLLILPFKINMDSAALNSSHAAPPNLSSHSGALRKLIPKTQIKFMSLSDIKKLIKVPRTKITEEKDQDYH